MSLEVLPTIRKNPRLEWRMASETARLAALVESLPWTSTPMPISVIQRTRAIGFLLSLECGKFHHHQFINHQKSKREDEGDYPGNACDLAAQRANCQMSQKFFSPRSDSGAPVRPPDKPTPTAHIHRNKDLPHALHHTVSLARQQRPRGGRLL